VSTVSSPPTEHHEADKTKLPAYSTTPGAFHFLLRRLHSLMGLIFGAYIVVHLTVNASGFSPSTYQGMVNHIHSLEPALPVVELVSIFIPLLIHVIYGLYIAFFGIKFNTTKYHYLGNLRFTLQRWSAVVLLLFIAFHVGTLHKWGLGGIGNLIEASHPADGTFMANVRDWCLNWGNLFNPEIAYQSTVSGVRDFFYEDGKVTLGSIIVMAFYLLGIWSATFHFANGLWTSAIAWGLTTTAESQKRWGHVCLGFFVVLTLIGTAAWLAFTVFGNPNYTPS
jgi:succinate dehydrogenase / fumarate reductase cytochrome b subunit